MESNALKTSEFLNIPLTEVIDPEVKPKKQPRRILHFSDGILEEYSTDEEDEVDNKNKTKIDPKKLSWLPWIWFYTVASAWKALSMADFCGEKVAYVFGITSPKYQYAIDEYHRLKEEEEEEKQQDEREAAADRQRQLSKLSSAEGGEAIQVAVKGEAVVVKTVTEETVKY